MKDFQKTDKRRNNQILKLRLKDPVKWTYQALGNKYSMTKQRIQKILESMAHRQAIDKER